MTPTPLHPALTFLLALFSGWVNRHWECVIDYLVEEDRILRRKIGNRRIRFTDAERVRLARLGKALGRKLLTKVATIVTPDLGVVSKRIKSLRESNRQTGDSFIPLSGRSCSHEEPTPRFSLVDGTVRVSRKLGGRPTAPV